MKTYCDKYPDGCQMCDLLLCEGSAKYDHHDFLHRKRQTNADRIRQMSDEELAEAFAYQCMGRVCKGIPFGGENECVSCWLDWLRQEVDNGD